MSWRRMDEAVEPGREALAAALTAATQCVTFDTSPATVAIGQLMDENVAFSPLASRSNAATSRPTATTVQRRPCRSHWPRQ